MRTWLTVIVINILLACEGTAAGELSSSPTHAPSRVELHDQFDVPQRLSFPATNVTILTIADRKGAEEVDGWIAALKPLYAGRADFRGLADVAAVPKWLHARVRARFQQTRRYPVMLDWSGDVCTLFGYQPGTANLVIIDRDGSIRARICGSASPATVASARAALEAALSPAAEKRSGGVPSAHR